MLPTSQSLRSIACFYRACEVQLPEFLCNGRPLALSFARRLAQAPPPQRTRKTDKPKWGETRWIILCFRLEPSSNLAAELESPIAPTEAKLKTCPTPAVLDFEPLSHWTGRSRFLWCWVKRGSPKTGHTHAKKLPGTGKPAQTWGKTAGFQEGWLNRKGNQPLHMSLFCTWHFHLLNGYEGICVSPALCRSC